MDASGIACSAQHSTRVCSTCPFGGAKVGTRGDPASPFVLVGEGPGHDEVRTGVPFTGKSGKLLWKLLKVAESDNWFVTNAIHCPKMVKQVKGKEVDVQKAKAELAHAVKQCREHLIREITSHPRKLVVALGNGALWSLTGNFDLGITSQRGKLLASELAEYGILPIVHPAAMLRGTGNFRQFSEDLDYAQRIYLHKEFKKPIVPEIEVVEDQARGEAVVKDLLNFEYLAGDIETGGFSPRTTELLSFGVAGDPQKVYIFTAELAETGILKPLFDSDKIRWIWQNGKFDTQWMVLPQHGGYTNARTDEDTMLLSYALDESTGCHDLETISGDLLGAPDYKHMVEPYVGKGKKKKSYRLIPKPILYQYQAYDVSNTLQCFFILRDRVRRDPDLDKLYTKTLIPSSDLLAWAESNGFYADPERMLENGERLTKEMTEIEAELAAVAKRNVNPNSTYDVAALLYDEIGIKPHRNSRSTDKGHLEKLPPHPAVKLIQKHRKLSKANGTYVKGLIDKIEPDGRIHTSFLIHGTRTGRLSSKEPNMQNIPRDPLIRGSFIAAPGKVLIEFDLDQAELRVLAHLANDEYLCGLYNDGTRNLHDEMSAFLFRGWENRKETFEGKEERMRAKAVNFGIPYGREAFSIAEEFDVRSSEAQTWIDAWFVRAPGAKAFIQRCRQAPIKLQTLVTPFGFKKRHYIVTNENLGHLQNEAANFPMQNIASTITLHVGIAVKPKLIEIGTKVVNLVHDSLITEADDNPDAIARTREIIEPIVPLIAKQWGITRVPIICDCKIGYRWGSLVSPSKFKPLDYPNVSTL